MNNYERDFYDDEENVYGDEPNYDGEENAYGDEPKYAGSYAQDVMGFDDETIDDAFDGDPEVYWNID